MGRHSEATDEDARAFLQERIALFGEVMTFVSLAGVLAQLVSGALLAGSLQLAPILLSAVSGGATAMVWLICRRGRHPPRFLRAVEALGLYVSIVAVFALGKFLVPLTVEMSLGLSPATAPPGSLRNEVHLAQIVVLMSICVGLTLTFAVRAALVPTRPLYTMVLTAGALVPMIVIFGGGVIPSPAEATVAAHVTLDDRIAAVAQGALWWCFTIGVCVVISKVVYGLTREVREAQKLGQYMLEEKLGEGGMGVVYRARHALMRRPSAIKLLASDQVGEESLARFEREVRLTARLTHPNTITVFDYGRTPDGVFYYAMELLEGANLGEAVEVGGPMPASRVASIMHQLSGALEEAHGIGLIHRDIKPGNVILCRRGGVPDVAKLLDFGLVKDLGGTPEKSLTHDGAITGTPLYMAPEAVTDPDAVDGRADLYSLGAVAYFLLTGTHVFEGKNPVEVLGHHLHTAPESPSKRLGREVPADLEALVLGCLAKDPSERPLGAKELRAEVAATGLLESWRRDDAERWWAEHGEAVRRTSGRPPAPQRTLDVDFEARGPLTET